MAERRIGIIVNGATGRMGYRQHLVRALLAIRDQGTVEIADTPENRGMLRRVAFLLQVEEPSAKSASPKEEDSK